MQIIGPDMASIIHSCPSSILVHQTCQAVSFAVPGVPVSNQDLGCAELLKDVPGRVMTLQETAEGCVPCSGLKRFCDFIPFSRGSPGAMNVEGAHKVSQPQAKDQ